MAETLGEHVFEFFLRNKRAEWDDYRRQVTAYERDRMLPVLRTLLVVEHEPGCSIDRFEALARRARSGCEMDVVAGRSAAGDVPCRRLMTTALVPTVS